MKRVSNQKNQLNVQRGGIFPPIAISLMLLLASCGGTGNRNPAEKTTEVTDTTQQQPLRIAYLPITHALPLFISNELPDEVKQFKKLELVRFSSWTELVEALNSGRVDGASILVQLALRSKEAGFPIKAVALGHRDGNVVVVSPNIKKPEDLVGKTIAIPHRQSSHNVLLNLTLRKAGIDLAQVKITELPPPEMPAALAEGRISGYVVAEPFGARGVVSGSGKVLYQSDELWKNSICCALVIRDEVIANRFSDVNAFMADYLEASDRLVNNFDSIVPQTKKYLNVDDAVLKQSLEWISFANLAIDQTDYDLLIRYVKEFGLSSSPPSFPDFVDNQFTSHFYSNR